MKRSAEYALVPEPTAASALPSQEEMFTQSSSKHVQDEMVRLQAQRQRQTATRQNQHARRLNTHLDKEREALRQWDAQECAFHMVQARQRAALRLQKGRAGWADEWLWVWVRCSLRDPLQHFHDVGTAHGERQLARLLLHGPHKSLAARLSDDATDAIAQLEQYCTEVKSMADLYGQMKERVSEASNITTGERAESIVVAADWWRWMHTVAADELRKRQLLLASKTLKAIDYYTASGDDTVSLLTACAVEQNHAVAPAVVVDIHQLLAAKNCAELLAMQLRVTQKLKSGVPMDIEYWELLLSTLVIFLARRRLLEQCAEITNDYRQWLSSMQPLLLPEFDAALDEACNKQSAGVGGEAAEAAAVESTEAKLTVVAAPVQRGIPYDDSPEVEKLRKLVMDLRLEFRGENHLMTEVDVVDDFPDVRHYPPLANETRPRCRPRFHNVAKRVYNWNQYTSAHYSKENPPPVLVRGYYFHIFYPHLLNATEVTPKFKRFADPNSIPNPNRPKSPLTELIRFSAGPPYEDIVFRIHLGDWDISARHGWLSVFEDGILRLYFLFQRERYRR